MAQLTQTCLTLLSTNGANYGIMVAIILLGLGRSDMAIASPIIRSASAKVTIMQTISSNDVKIHKKGNDQTLKSKVQVFKSFVVRQCESMTLNVSQSERKKLCQLNLIETY